MNQETLKYLCRKGYSLYNTQQGKTNPFVFCFFGKQWTTNKKRVYKYSFDSPYWEVFGKLSVFEKLLLIVTGKVKKLKEI